MKSRAKVLLAIFVLAVIYILPGLALAASGANAPESPGFSIFNEAQDCTGGFTIPGAGGGMRFATCTLCDLLTVVQNAINYAVFIIIPVAALVIMWGGFNVMTSGGNTGKLENGRKIMTSAAIGLAITLGAWIIVDEVLSVLAQGRPNWTWWKIECTSENYVAQNPNPSGGGLDGAGSSTFSGGGGEFGGGGASAEWGSDTLDGSSNGTTWEDGYDISSPEDQALLDQNISWDQSSGSSTCTRNELASYSSDISAAAQRYGVSPARIQAIVMAESGGNTNASHQDLDGQSSWGLMQIRPDTARIYDPSLRGLTDIQVAQKLKDSAYNMDMGARYYSDLLKKYNGNATLASAAYNGGPGANLPSKDCATGTRWQCLWDDTAHTQPNTGYDPTRKYIQNIDAVESKINSGQCS